jgi:hypothetical protein
MLKLSEAELREFGIHGYVVVRDVIPSRPRCIESRDCDGSSRPGMKATLITVIAILFLNGSSMEVSLASVEPNQSVLMQGETKRTRKVRLAFSYLLLPDDYRAYQTNDLRDAW